MYSDCTLYSYHIICVLPAEKGIRHEVDLKKAKAHIVSNYNISMNRQSSIWQGWCATILLDLLCKTWLFLKRSQNRKIRNWFYYFPNRSFFPFCFWIDSHSFSLNLIEFSKTYVALSSFLLVWKTFNTTKWHIMGESITKNKAENGNGWGVTMEWMDVIQQQKIISCT